MARALAARYFVAVAAVGLAVIPWLVWGNELQPSPFPLLVAAIAVGSWYGGLAPGVLSAVLGSLLLWYLYLPPKYTLAIDSLRSVLQLASFVVVALLIGLLNAQRQRRDEELGRLLESEHRARLELEAAESTLRTVIRASPLSIVSLDLEGTITSWNQAAERIFGWTEAEVLGGPAPTIPAGAEEASEEVRRRVLEGEVVTGLERRRLRKDGSLIDVSMATGPLYDTQGQVTGTVVLAEDVTVRKRMEKERNALLQSEQRSREAAEAARTRSEFLALAGSVLSGSLDYEETLASVARLAVPQIGDWCAVHIVEPDGGVRQLATEHVDPAKVRLAEELGREYPFDPAAPTGAALVIRTGEPELIETIPDELLEEAAPDERILHILRDLGLRSSMVVPMRVRDKVLGAITFVSAESGRVYSADDLSLAQELADRAALAVDNARLFGEVAEVAAQQVAILEQIVDAIIITDAHGRTQFMNEAARTISGVDVLGVPLERQAEAYGFLLPGGGPVDEGALPLHRALVGGETVRDVDLIARRPNGGAVTIQAGATPITTRDAVRIGAVMSFRDVTAQRTLERQKDDFLSAAAHDLKNPLATIKTMAQMLRRRVARADTLDIGRLVEGLERIDITATRMASLVNELLDVARFQMGAPLVLDRKPADLVAILSAAVDEQQHVTERHTIHFAAGDEPIEGLWDVSRLERVFDNLLANAIKYSPAGGDITVTCLRDGTGGNGDAVISVQDAGIGIPVDDLPHIFDRFYRGRNAASGTTGTGLGLAGVKQVVEEHGGSIAVESHEGQGSTFIVRLAVTSPASGPIPSAVSHVNAG